MNRIVIAGVLMLLLCSLTGFAQTPPPTNLTATIGDMGHFSSVNLSWQYADSFDTVRFNIYRKSGALDDTTGHFSRIGATRDTKYYDFMVQVGKTYSYYVTAVLSHVESDSSNNVEAATTPPVHLYGKISGKLFDDSSLAPIAGGVVRFFPASFMMNAVPQAWTDSNGFFSVKLSAGDYYIYSGAKGYLPEYYDNVQNILQATKVTVNGNDSLTFNIGLSKPVPPVYYSLTGWVKDSSGNPVKTVLTAFVINKRSLAFWQEHGRDHDGLNGGPNSWKDWGRQGYSTITDSLGNYSFKFLAGDTVVIFAQARHVDFVPQFWNGKTTFADADRIPVNGDVADINFTLGAAPVYANGISGSVRDSSGTYPLNAYVFAYNTSGANNKKKFNVPTDTLTGNYAFANLAPGKYLLLAWAKGYKPSFFRYDGTTTFDWRKADSVVVSDSGVVPDINFYLKPFHVKAESLLVIGGVAANNGGALDGALTYALDDGGNIAGCAVTDLDGSFAIAGLPPGNYTVVTNAPDFGTAQTGTITVDDVNSIQSVSIVVSPNAVLGVKTQPAIANQYALLQNYPNPFNPSTVIKYQLPFASYVTVIIYNQLGQEVSTLVDQIQDAGLKSVKWNAGGAASGIYYYQFRAVSTSDPSQTYSQTEKMLLIK